MSWEQRGLMCRLALAPARSLLGAWEGEGASYGQPLRGRLEVRERFGGTWIEAAETLWDAAGAVDHEDLTLYRFDPEAGQLRALQVMAHAWSQDHVVLVEPDGLRWYHGPSSPTVRLRFAGEDRLRVEVREPEDGEIVLAMDYRRLA